MARTKKMKLPSKMNLLGRTSTITNAFAHSIDPRIANLDGEALQDYYKELQIEEGQCAYCLAKQSAYTVDHLHSIVVDKKPSGFITENNNLIPCCQRCNSKKGGSSFEDWYLDEKTVTYLKNEKHLTDEQIKERFDLIVKFQKNHPAIHIDYEEVLGKEEWKKFNDFINESHKMLEKYQEYCDSVAEKIKQSLASK